MRTRFLLAALAAGAALTATSVAAAPVLNPGNGRYYEYVSGPVLFSAALTGATAKTFAGKQGHLVTFTSAEENQFVMSLLPSVVNVWLAGSDEDSEGLWKWVAGPEAGQTFWNNGTTLIYANWDPRVPNGRTSENYLIGGNQISGQWEDVNANATYGYVVEYGTSIAGGVPEPATWVMMIAGFGMIGGAMRRRQTQIRFAIA